MDKDEGVVRCINCGRSPKANLTAQLKLDIANEAIARGSARALSQESQKGFVEIQHRAVPVPRPLPRGTIQDWVRNKARLEEIIAVGEDVVRQRDYERRKATARATRQKFSERLLELAILHRAMGDKIKEIANDA